MFSYRFLLFLAGIFLRKRFIKIALLFFYVQVRLSLRPHSIHGNHDLKKKPFESTLEDASTGYSISGLCEKFTMTEIGETLIRKAHLSLILRLAK